MNNRILFRVTKVSLLEEGSDVVRVDRDCKPIHSLTRTIHETSITKPAPENSGCSGSGMIARMKLGYQSNVDKNRGWPE
jgi:hypothetical protein